MIILISAPNIQIPHSMDWSIKPQAPLTTLVNNHVKIKQLESRQKICIIDRLFNTAS